MTKPIMLALTILLVSTQAAFGTDRPARTLQQQLYVWHGQFMSLDKSARVATINAQIPPHVERYVGQFKSGDRLLLVWNMIGRAEAESVLALWQLKSEKKPILDTGYILPIEFVSADTTTHIVTFRVALSSSAVRSLTSIAAARWIRVETPMVQGPQVELIVSVEERDSRK